MAQGLLLVSGSPLIGSPHTYKVQAAVVNGTVAFHRVKLTVSCWLSNAAKRMNLTLSSPAESGEVLEFDISSALRAAADQYEYTPEAVAAYPSVKYTLSACDEYMQNGEVHDNVGVVTSEGGTCYFGAYSDLERWVSDGSRQMPKSFTRKPKTAPEVVCVGESIIAPDQEVPGCTEHRITQEGMQTVNGREVYALSKQPHRYEFRFVNSLGCLESIGVLSLSQSEMNVTSESFVRSLPEHFGRFSRGVIVKRNDHESIKLSSGPVDEAWQSWFMHEFLMAKICWIKVVGHWVPCHIVPDDTVQGADYTADKLREVLFTARIDINGSLLPELMV